MTLDLNAFKKMGGCAYQDSYVSKEPLEIAPFGKFVLEICPEKGTKVSDEMLEILNETIKRTIRDSDAILDLVHKHYKCVEEQDFLFDIPGGLSREQILPYLSGHRIRVQDADYEDGPVEHRVYFSPKWDEEHGMYLEYQEGKWIFAECLG